MSGEAPFGDRYFPVRVGISRRSEGRLALLLNIL